MTFRLAILAALALCGGSCCAAVSRLDAEDSLRRHLEQRDLRPGFDAETGAYTVIASAARSGCEPGSSASCAQRVTCYRLAELKAIHQILNMRGQNMAGKSEMRREQDGDATDKAVRTFVETLSQGDLDGCVVVDSCERTEGAECVVAVAMTWSADLARRARASADGSLRPAGNWIEELKGYLDEWGDGLLPPVVTFSDSAGYLHRLGVGMAALDGETPLQRNAAARLADMWARKNLQLALFGRAAMRKKAELLKVSSRRDELQNLTSAYEALGEAAAEGPLPSGSLSVLDTVMADSANANKLLIVVYGVHSQGPAAVSAGSGAPPGRGAPSGILIFNPKTGKFENQ